MYVLDTNILVYFFKGIGDVSQRLFATPPSEIGVPSIVLFELEFGIMKSASPQKRKVQLREFMSLVKLLPFHRRDAVQAATIRSRLEKRGIPIGPYDLLIAATTMARDGVLVTHNQREFARIEGLKIQDWFA